MQRGHFTMGRDGRSVKREDPPQRAGSNVARRLHHDTQHIFNKHRIGRRKEQMVSDELPREEGDAYTRIAPAR
jgi:hypothetical protein